MARSGSGTRGSLVAPDHAGPSGRRQPIVALTVPRKSTVEMVPRPFLTIRRDGGRMFPWVSARAPSLSPPRRSAESPAIPAAKGDQKPRPLKLATNSRPNGKTCFVGSLPVARRAPWPPTLRSVTRRSGSRWTTSVSRVPTRLNPHHSATADQVPQTVARTDVRTTCNGSGSAGPRQDSRAPDAVLKQRR